MYPHKKLDWHIGRLERSLADNPSDSTIRHDLARAALSRGLYHGGGETWCSKSLSLARKVLSDTPDHTAAMVTAGTALVGLGRPDAARKYLDRALQAEPNRADAHLAYGALHRSEGDRRRAVSHLERACQLAPDDWETHLFLGRALAELGRKMDKKKRLIERSQYHLVQALKREPTADLSAPLLRDLGVSCLETSRFGDAEKFFVRLREHDDFAAQARFHLGIVAYQLGKYKAAVTHYRQYLREKPDDAKALGQIAMAYLQLGEFTKSQEYANKALLVRSDDLQARYTLGCAFAEEGRIGDAAKVFRSILEDHAEHMPSFIELCRIRRKARDIKWLIQALVAEAGKFDRLPLASGEITPRSIARKRLDVLLEELHQVGPSAISHLVRSIELVQEEGVRFQIWEAACRLASSAAADEIAEKLRNGAEHYSTELGLQALGVAHAVPEQLLNRGLTLQEDDLKRAAVNRHGPANDVEGHRRNVELERNNARGYQALLLLSIATRQSRAGRRLLENWERTADPELSTAAKAGLTLYGDPKAVASLSARAAQQGTAGSIRTLLGQVIPPEQKRGSPRAVSDDEDVHCTTCGRTSETTAHLMAGSHAVICDHCILEIGKNRRDMLSSDDATCSFCGRSHLESKGVYGFNGVDICSHCLELSLGLVEREEVDRFFASW
ncbi:MAG: tetratricopeptide repeat protein [Myxococcota bacterium]|nr:tetratricopeptide repeat protein [Myxococcota bacterium]